MLSHQTRNRAAAAGPAHNTDAPPTPHAGAKNAARRPPTSPARSVPVRQTTAPAIPLQ